MEEGVASAGVSVAEFFKLSLYELVSLFSVSELQWCAATEGDFRLGQPDVGFLFVAKDLLGLASDCSGLIRELPLEGESVPVFSKLF